MQDHTIRLLKECNSGCKMAVNSMQQILGYVSDGKLRRLIEEYEEKHQKLEYESFRKLTELNEAGKEPEKSRTKQGAKEGHRQDGAPGETRQDREPDKTRKRSRS